MDKKFFESNDIKLKIIKYTKTYKKEIPELFTNTIHKTCNKDYTKEQLNAWTNPIIDYKSWEDRLAKTKPFLAIYDDKVVGFVEFYDNYIDCFYIHHMYQGKGIGKILLNYILELAEQNKIKTLNVDASITAKPFFEKYGFKEVKKNYIERKNQQLINYSLVLIR